MAGVVMAIDSALPPIGNGARLGLLVAAGMTVYAGALFAFARPIVDEVLGLIRRPGVRGQERAEHLLIDQRDAGRVVGRDGERCAGRSDSDVEVGYRAAGLASDAAEVSVEPEQEGRVSEERGDQNSRGGPSGVVWAYLSHGARPSIMGWPRARRERASRHGPRQE